VIYQETIRVTNIYERKGKRWISGHGEKAVTEEYPQGWTVILGNNLGIQFQNKPELNIGDYLMLSLERIAT
jgi:hypothetical protein